MLKKYSKIALKTSLLLALLLGVVLVPAGVYLAKNPLEISKHINFLDYDFTFGESRLYFQNLKLFYDGSLQLHGEGLVLIDKKTGLPHAQVKEAQLTLSNHGLMLGRLLVKHVQLKDVNLIVELWPELTKVGSIPLRNIQQKKTTTDVVAFLNGAHASQRWSALKTARMEGVNIQIEDKIYNQKWQISEAKFDLVKHRFSGEKASLTGFLKSENLLEKEPLEIHVHHGYKANKMKLQVVLNNSDTQLVQPYLPLKLKNLINAQGKLQLTLNLLEENKISDAQFHFNLTEAELRLPDWYEAPFKFRQFELQGSYDGAEEGGLMQLEHLAAVDHEDVKIQASASVSGVESGALHIKMLSQTEDISFLKLIKYFPDQKMEKTVAWMQENIKQGHVESLELGYDGNPALLPHCLAECGFSARVSYRDGRLTFLPRVSEISLNKGLFILEEDKLTASAEKGGLKSQKLTDLQVKIDNLFSPATSYLHVNVGQADGKLEEALGQIDAYLEQTEWRPDVVGYHSTGGTIVVPLGDGDVALADVGLDLNSMFSSLETTVPHQDSLKFKADRARLELTDKHLKIQSEGTLNDSVEAEISWIEDMRHLGEQAKIHVKGHVSGDFLMSLQKDPKFGVEGKLPFQLNIQQQSPQKFNFSVTSDLTSGVLNIKPIGWSKAAEIPAKLSGDGQFVGKAVELNSFKVVGEDVHIEGRLRFGENAATSVVDLTTLKAGRTDAAVSWNGKELIVKGQTLDLSHLPIEWGNNQEPLPNMFGTVALNNLYLAGDTLHEINGHFNYADGLWTKTELTGKTTDRATIILSTYTENGIPKLNLQAGNGGSFLRAIGFYKQMREGRMTLNLSFLKEGITGVFYFEDAYLQDAPLVVKLVSLLSLEELLSGKNGILFSNISLPFYLRDNILILEPSRFKGPSIGMKIEGGYNLTTSELNMKGQLTPAENLNSLVGKIPLIGQVVTGSQEGVLVADFKVSGKHDNPTVFVNPLSVVTPGILKDIFGVFESDRTPGVQKPAEAPDVPKVPEENQVQKDKK